MPVLERWVRLPKVPQNPAQPLGFCRKLVLQNVSHSVKLVELYKDLKSQRLRFAIWESKVQAGELRKEETLAQAGMNGKKAPKHVTYAWRACWHKNAAIPNCVRL